MHQTLRLVCARVAGIVGLTPEDCPMFASRSMASGVYASLLDWTNKAGIIKLQIEETLANVAALNYSCVASPYSVFFVFVLSVLSFFAQSLSRIFCHLFRICFANHS